MKKVRYYQDSQYGKIKRDLVQLYVFAGTLIVIGLMALVVY